MTPDQIVDAVRALHITNSGAYSSMEELNQLGGIIARQETRYQDLKRRMSSDDAFCIANVEMVTELLGGDVEAASNEMLRRLTARRRQSRANIFTVE